MLFVNSSQQNKFTKMAVRRRTRGVILTNVTSTYVHLRNHLHIPNSFSHPVEREFLDVDVASENLTGNVTTIFHPSFDWEQVLNKIKQTISSPDTIRNEGDPWIYERTFRSAIGQRVVWDSHGKLNRIPCWNLRVVARLSVRRSRRNRRRIQTCHDVITFTSPQFSNK